LREQEDIKSCTGGPAFFWAANARVGLVVPIVWVFKRGILGTAQRRNIRQGNTKFFNDSLYQRMSDDLQLGGVSKRTHDGNNTASKILNR
jgi:hypothetical protein